MDVIQLSERLKTVASFVEKDAIVADIGSDHAYLPCYLIQATIAKKAIAGEVVQGPYHSALHTVQKYGLTDAVTVRLRDGLAAIEAEDEVDTVIIAGMGGSLIASILEQGEPHLHGVKRIIAQPNIHAEAIRQWAMAANWKLIAEKILKEDHKIYEILVLERGSAHYLPLEILVGPFLLKEQSPVFLEKWCREMKQWDRILVSLDRAEQSRETIQKKEELKTKIGWIRKVLST